MEKSGQKGNEDVPDIGFLSNKLVHQLTALNVIQDNYLHSALSKIAISTQKSLVLADNNAGDAV